MLKHVVWRDQHGWGRVAIRLDGNHVTFKTLCGKGLLVDYLHAVLDAAIPGWRQRAEDLHLTRKNPWRIDFRRRASGRMEFVLRYLRNQLLHDVPTAAKISMSSSWEISQFEMWLGDLAPLAAEIKRAYGQVVLPEKEEENGKFRAETLDCSYLELEVIEPCLIGDFRAPGTPSGITEDPEV